MGLIAGYPVGSDLSDADSAIHRFNYWGQLSTDKSRYFAITEVNNCFFFISLIVSGRYPENPAIWLVSGAGSIFLSPDHGHCNQLRSAQSEVANWKKWLLLHFAKFVDFWKRNFTQCKNIPDQFVLLYICWHVDEKLNNERRQRYYLFICFVKLHIWHIIDGRQGTLKGSYC